MRIPQAFCRLFLLFAACLTFSCAQPRPVPIPSTHLPPENLPQIGSTYSPSSTEHHRPVIIESMISRAKIQLGQNRPQEAFQTLERALAVDGRDPMLWHLMSKIRLIQRQYAQAESLARKSNTLAGPNLSLREKNQRIIEDVQERQGRVQRTDNHNPSKN